MSVTILNHGFTYPSFVLGGCSYSTSLAMMEKEEAEGAWNALRISHMGINLLTKRGLHYIFRERISVATHRGIQRMRHIYAIGIQQAVYMMHWGSQLFVAQNIKKKCTIARLQQKRDAWLARPLMQPTGIKVCYRLSTIVVSPSN